MANYNYNPYMYGYGNPYQYGNNYQLQQPQQATQQAQRMNNSFITVQNEEEARNYPVAPSNSVLMRDENSGYIYCKTMGYSQLDKPTFERYRLVKDDITPEKAQKDVLADKPINNIEYATKSEYEAIMSDITALKKEVNALKRKLNRKEEKEVEDDE